jgi:hypothetical protein
MNVSLFFLLAALGLFLAGLAVTAGAHLLGVSNASFIDAGLACLAVSFLPSRRSIN